MGSVIVPAESEYAILSFLQKSETENTQKIAYAFLLPVPASVFTSFCSSQLSPSQAKQLILGHSSKC